VLLAGGSQLAPTSAELYQPASPVPAPVLFTLEGQQGAIWNATTGQVVAPGAPAGGGDVLAMYTTNLIEGGLILPRVFLDGRSAPVLYFGDAPGYPGYFQINFQVPDGAAAGNAVALRLGYLGRSSNAVTIAIH